MLHRLPARVRPFVAALAACGLTVWLVAQLAPTLTLAPLWAFALAYVAVTCEIMLLSRLAPELPRAYAVLFCSLCLAALLALSWAAATPLAAASLTIALAGGASLLGAAVGARIEKPGQLTAVALVSALADLWSVFDPSAPSARFAEQVLAHPERLALFALPFPLLGSPLLPAVIGAGDVVFAALYLSAFRAHGLSLLRVTVALTTAFLVGLLVLVTTLRPIPLLPLIGAAVVACDPAARSLTGREWRTVLVVCAALISAVVLRLAR